MPLDPLRIRTDMRVCACAVIALQPQHHPNHPHPRLDLLRPQIFSSATPAVAMSLARDDTGNIRELHTKASGLSRDFRDASGGSGETQPYVNSSNYHPILYVQTGRFPTDGGKSLRQFRPQEKYVPPRPLLLARS
jgi:hypothetical protein